MKRIPKITWATPPTEAQQMVMLVSQARHALESIVESLRDAERAYEAGNTHAAATHCGKALGTVLNHKNDLYGVEGQLHEAFGEEVPE